MWVRTWHCFEHGLKATKTKAHATLADVDRGLSTHWERAANGHADALAKKGAALHPSTAQAAEELDALKLLVSEVCVWAGTQAGT